MAAGDFADSNPNNSTAYADVLDDLKQRNLAVGQMFHDTPVNPIAGFMRWVRDSATTGHLEEYPDAGSTWVAHALTVAGGGTGATTAGGARTALEIGTMGTQAANNVAITGGTIGTGGGGDRVDSVDSSGSGTFGSIVCAGSIATPTTITCSGVLSTTNTTATAITSGGGISAAGSIVTTGTGPHVIGGVTTDYTRLKLTGAFTSGGAANAAEALLVEGIITGHSGDSSFLAGTRLSNDFVTGRAVSNVAQLYLTEPTLDVSAGAVTNSAAIYINSVATEAANNYAILVNTGATKLGGTLECTDTGVASLKVGGGLTIGTGSVTLVGTDGKISGPLSSTIIDNLSGANLTTLNLGQAANTGTVATARLGSGTASSSTFLRGDQSWAALALGLPILQIVTASTTTLLQSASGTYVDTNLTASITPAATANKILVFISQDAIASHVNPSTYSGAGMDMQVLRDATVLGNPVLDGRNMYQGSHGPVTFIGYDSPSSTSALTYKTQVKCTSTATNNRVFCQRDSTQSTIILIEIDN